ncbi:hypothetical protein ACQP1O_18025 [Nocardia sp. CA-151230]|uniref:hypothetical protein n=1 Tax=Nocardia sp. CA-151230 TaxID=3239982 RepID=UPI003D8FA3F8
MQLLAEEQAWEQQADTHNNAAPTIDNTNVAAVDTYNTEADQLESEGAAIQAKAQSCFLSGANAAPAPSQSAKPSGDKQTPSTSAVAAPSAPRAPPGPTEVELRNLPLTDEIKDPLCQAAYYNLYPSLGEFRRKGAHAVDFNGLSVPQIQLNSATNQYEIVDENLVGATFKPGTEKKQPAGIQLRVDAMRDVVKRYMSVQLVQALSAKADSEKAATGKVSDQTASDLTNAYVAQRDAGEGLGHIAGKQYLDDRYPSSDYNVNLISDPARAGPGSFDKVYEVIDRATGKTKIVIVEEKGPQARLGSRIGDDAKRYEQGSGGYYRAIITEMANNGTPIERSLANRLLTTNPADLEYVLVRARVQDLKKNGQVVGEQYGGYACKTFDLGM